MYVHIIYVCIYVCREKAKHIILSVHSYILTLPSSIKAILFLFPIQTTTFCPYIYLISRMEMLWGLIPGS